MNQKDATELGYKLLKDAPLSDEARGYVEASLPYIVQRYYLGGYEIVPRAPKTSITMEELIQMHKDKVIY